MSALLVLLPHAEDEPLVWSLRQSNGAVRWARAHDEPPPAGVRDVIAIAPGADVTVHHVMLPAKSDAQARAAAPFAVEDEIALEVEAIHTALGPRPSEPEAPRTVAVVSEERMSAWRAMLDEVGLRPVRMTPDYLALAAPEEPDSAHMLDAGGHILLRTARGGLAVERDLAAIVIPPVLEDEGVARLIAWTDQPHALGLETQPHSVEVHPALSDADLWAQLHLGVHQPSAISLLQGAHRVRNTGGDQNWVRPWRGVGALAAALLVVWLGVVALETWSYRHAAAEVRALAAEAYAQAFPQEGRVSDPVRRAQARLAEGGGPNQPGFIELSAIAFEAVAPLERVQIESVRFDHDDGRLLISMIYNTYSDVEAFSAAAAARGVLVEEGGSRRSGRRMSGDLTLRAP